MWCFDMTDPAGWVEVSFRDDRAVVAMGGVPCSLAFHFQGLRISFDQYKEKEARVQAIPWLSTENLAIRIALSAAPPLQKTTRR